MSHREPARLAAPRRQIASLAALVCVSATLIGAVAGPLGGPSLASSVADGAVRPGLTPFDREMPAVANLDSGLRNALRHAARDAAHDGVEIFITSGWRSPDYQARLLGAAVSKYGSEENAARWVASVDTSSHVSGHAIDVGPSHATTWLSRHGAAYGLCQIYRNEPWHYELRPDAIDDGCPPMYADPRHDPRMQLWPAERLQRRRPVVPFPSAQRRPGPLS